MGALVFALPLWLRLAASASTSSSAGGTANAVLMAILMPVLFFLGIGLFIGMFVVGWQALPRAHPLAPVVMYAFDGVVVLFLFSWAVTLLAELQRAEVLSIDKFLHLPVSIKGVFLINFLSSLVSLNLAVFTDAGFGGAYLGHGGRHQPGHAAAPAARYGCLFLMVTALTYQFQGWLASLMVNPRRLRRPCWCW